MAIEWRDKKNLVAEVVSLVGTPTACLHCRHLGVRNGPRLPYYYLGWRRMIETFGEHLNSALWLTLSAGRYELQHEMAT